MSDEFPIIRTPMWPLRRRARASDSAQRKQTSYQRDTGEVEQMDRPPNVRRSPAPRQLDSFPTDAQLDEMLKE